MRVDKRRFRDSLMVFLLITVIGFLGGEFRIFHVCHAKIHGILRFHVAHPWDDFIWTVPFSLVIGLSWYSRRRFNEVKKSQKEIFEANTELRTMNNVLKYYATTDELTGLYNMRQFYEEIESEVGRSERYGHNLSILLMDVNNFKRYNDTHGHKDGDIVLKNLAKSITKHLRKHDKGFRYGGDEFIVILPETKKEDAIFASNRIKNEFDNLEHNNRTRKKGDPTVSIGVCEFKSGMTHGDLVRMADKEMYRMKGKDKIADMMSGKDDDLIGERK